MDQLAEQFIPNLNIQIHELSIHRYRELLARETDGSQRQVLLSLLGHEEANQPVPPWQKGRIGRLSRRLHLLTLAASERSIHS